MVDISGEAACELIGGLIAATPGHDVDQILPSRKGCMMPPSAMRLLFDYGALPEPTICAGRSNA